MAGNVFDFMKLWTQGDQESERKLQKILLMGLDKVVQGQSDVLSKISVGPAVAGPVVRWMEEWGYPSQIKASLDDDTMTFSGYLFGKEINSESVKKVIRAGTILERPSDGVQAKVSSATGLTALVSAYGNTTLSDDEEPQSWDIIAEVWSDYRDASDPRALDRIFREVGTQIHAETFEIPKTRKNTKYEIVANETERQISALLEKLRRQLAYAVLRSRPYHDGSDYVYGNKTEEPTMCGICTWPIITQAELSNPSVYVNKNSTALTKADLDDLVRYLWLDEHADYNKGNWWIVCHPLTHRYIHDFDIAYRRMEKSDTGVGFYVDNFDAKIGKSFPILSDRYMRPDVLIVVDFDAAKYGYFANDRMDRKEIPTQGRYQRWLISFQTYGVVVRNPRSNIGMIHRLPHTR
ncbi:MAG: DUF5309 family protein [Desulfomonile sp.]|jgi:hypothetical protein|nr:DUF5309 family protein [Deltaproteobacteria bacterium]